VVQYDRTIPPGGEGKIVLRVDTRGFIGTVRKEAKVYSNDPENGTVIITLQANVKLSIQVSPKSIKLAGYEGTVITQSVIITANEEKSLEIELIQSNLSERITHEIEVIEPGRIFKVNFNYTPIPGDNLKGNLIIKTNYPERPNINIPVTARFQKKTTSKYNRSQ